MKKVITLLLACAFALGLVGCGKNEATERSFVEKNQGRSWDNAKKQKPQTPQVKRGAQSARIIIG